MRLGLSQGSNGYDYRKEGIRFSNRLGKVADGYDYALTLRITIHRREAQ